ncbi:hypothetical protein ACLB2K_016705 [Fragaria x ananassa]
MHSNHLLLEEPIRMASILEPSKASFFPTMTKIVGTLGPKSRSVEVISSCLNAGMSVARFDFSLETDRVVNRGEKIIELKGDGLVILTPDQGQEPSLELLPINFDALSKAVTKGDTVFIGQYLFTGSETTSAWLEVKLNLHVTLYFLP